MSAPSNYTGGQAPGVGGQAGVGVSQRQWHRRPASDAAPSIPNPSPTPDPRTPTPPRTLITLATYNERDNLPRLIDEILRVLPGCHILVIDDNSPDGTGRLADLVATREPRVRVLHRTGKLGLGSAILAGMRHAVEHDYDYLLNMDADFSHPPRYLPALVAAMEPAPVGPASGTARSVVARPGLKEQPAVWSNERGSSREPVPFSPRPFSGHPPSGTGVSPVDVAVGSRYVPGGAIEGWPLRRHFMSRAINAYARVLLRLPVRDASGALRCYRVSKLREIDFDRVRSSGYSFQEEILWHLARRSARMVEVPITFENRRAGASKINNREALVALWIMLQLALQ